MQKMKYLYAYEGEMIMASKKLVMKIAQIFIVLLLILNVSHSYASTAAGYSDYYIPGDEVSMWTIFNTLDASGTTPMHSLISVTAWSDNTIIYYDHWENGYTFDPTNPAATADEIYSLTFAGDVKIFESSNIPTAPRGIGQFYDGGDRIYAAGGVVTITRSSWIEARGVGNQAVAWEIYPLKPQLTTYVLPFGENLGFVDFRRVFVLIQATEDNTTVQVDLNNDGIFDNLNQNRDGDKTDAGDTNTVTLQRGQTFLLDRTSACPNGGTLCASNPGTLNSGTLIQGNATLQVKYVAGDVNWQYMARGFSAFPRGYWTKDYYGPLDEPTNARIADYFLYNPHSSGITISWESSTGSGSFPVGANATVSFRTATGGSVPQDSGIYFRGSDVFWGVGVGDSTQDLYEWGYSLLPSTMLYDEHFLGWAPDSNPPIAGRTDNGVFLMVAQDNTRVFVDLNNDGTPDQTYTLDRLQSQYITDPTDGNLTQTHFWATGPFTLAYGQNADTASTPQYGMDLGYVAIPGTDFISLVLTVDKLVSPQAVSTASGSTATFTIKANSQKYTLDGGANGVTVTDYLPPNWDYVSGTTTIIRPDKTIISGGSADPTKSGTGPYTLSWTSAQLGTNGTPGMAENQEVTITFTARTTAILPVGTLSQNRVKAVGKRTFGFPIQTQTFTTTDFAYVTSGDLQIAKTSNAPTPLYPGDTFTYTVTATNPASATSSQTGISVYDPLPAGVTYVSGSSQVTGTRSVLQTDNVHDRFSTAVYNSNAGGTANWASVWIESDSVQNASAGSVLIFGGELRLGGTSGTSTSNIYRQVNLSSTTTATLTLDYRTASLDDPDQTYIEIASSPGGPWTTVLNFQNDRSGSINYTIPNNLLTSTTTIRFRTAGYNTNNEYLYIDNVNITFTHRVSSYGTRQAGNPPDFVSASDVYSIAPGQQMTLTFNVSVDNPLATGIDKITNTAYVNSNEIILPMSASVTNIVVNPSAQSASVGDRIWFDTDGDAALDVGEPGLGNVEVVLKDRFGTPVRTSRTDVTGHYLFSNVAPGNSYYVEVSPGTLPAGLQQTAPVGRSDNRSNTFSLAAAQFYKDADIGYKSVPGSAAAGIFVWSDANSNGTRDPGESGVEGVTVQLCFDANGNGLWDPGEMTGCRSTSTASDGSYLFTGISASGTEDYFVYIDETQAVLTGYTRTTPPNNPLYINNLSGGNVVQYANFGYYSGSTYSITDRVWFDANGNGSDSGETGIALVTVELLNASLHTTATTITDTSGYFTFSGVIGGGADYTVRITDTNNKLADYFGTTAAALTGSLQIPNLAGTVDNTSAPHFGYNLRGAIGDTVFNDIDSDGTQDPGELGISGIIVKLYTDSGTIGIIDGSDAVVATRSTDAYGHYLFSGRRDGNYIVSIESPPPGYTYTGLDSDTGKTGHQQPASIISSGNALNKDFGYHAAAARSVSGIIWNDTSNDGIIDGGETGISGVSVSLLQGGNLIAATFTASDGSYGFNGLANGSYVVMVTDTACVLCGYIGTYEKTEGTGGSFDGQETVDLSTGNLSGVNFGYVQPIVPTRVVLTFFGAYELNGQVVIEWETAYEQNTLGFFILRHDPSTGAYLNITRGLLPGMITDPRGGIYSLIDRDAIPGETHRYKLVEVERDGRQIVYGPFEVSAETRNSAGSYSAVIKPVEAHGNGTPSQYSDYSRRPKRLSAVQESLSQMRKTAVKSASTLHKNANTAVKGSRIKIPIAEDGLYYMDATVISAITGFSQSIVTNMIGKSQIALSNRSYPVAYHPAQGYRGIYFYATGIDSAYTRDNVYWLDIGTGIVPGTAMNSERSTPPVSSNPDGTFTESLHIEQDIIPNMSQTNNPAADYWNWDLIYLSRGYSDGAKRFTFSVNGKADIEAPATLRVHLVGGSDAGVSHDHHVVVRLNGHQIGEGWWGGLSPYTITATFSQSLLDEGENTIEIEGLLDPGIPWSMFLIDSFDLNYKRRYVAFENTLFFTGDGNQSVTISGFTTQTPDILLLNVTNPNKPQVNLSANIKGSPGNYEISFQPASPNARYMAVAGDATRIVANATGVIPSNLKARNNLSDYLIIVPSELSSAVQPLADYRKSQGMITMVVKLDDIMNEFNYGISSPEVIRQFLMYIHKNWMRSPRYILLAGAGTWDYKDNLGEGGNLIPPAMVPTLYGLSTSDNYLADVNGDHLPEMAIGRLPVVTRGELQTLIRKIRTFEATPGNRVIMVADDPDDGGNFAADSENIAALFPPHLQMAKVYLGEYPSVTAARIPLLNYLNRGAIFFNFVGHGSYDILTAEELLTSDDAVSLTNSTNLPIVIAMTCLAGEFAIPGYPAISQVMMLKEGGGAVAFWSATGLSDNFEATILNREFYHAVFSGRKRLLGDAVMQALKKYQSSGSTPYMMDIYTILGDPALRIQ